ncbi:arsenic resistance N-acetyltransferase ArsN2 [Variovorax ureilyticus]|uniref:Arsenic resistance N-acetyltransferase ArsN2 n=1 Tax=Variovorax ureilyticus TaxID=1836198 RepID=A0ABU8VCG2_9BURK
MSDIVIRPAKESDWAAVAELLRVCALPLDGAQEHLSGFLLAVVDGVVVGTAGLEAYADTALLRSVAVSPAVRGRGIGHALVEAIHSEARRRGVKKLYLLTTTATNYFSKMGFSTVARRQAPAELEASAEFQGVCPSSAAFMSREV